MEKISKGLNDFLKMESSAGIMLMVAAVLAMVVNNTLFSAGYNAFLDTPVHITIGGVEIHKPLFLWINDGLMALFFFLVGLEIKREVLDGKLTGFDRSLLPLVAAFGGAVIPALLFVAINQGYDDYMRGWAIPMATDIAFALGILALIGARAPASLKVLLLAIAIIDDLMAVTVIALFYTANVSISYLLWSALTLVGLIVLNRLGVMRKLPYIVLGVVMWYFVLKSGVHATIAGVLTAFTIPMAVKKGEHHSMLEKMEHGLHPYIAFLILPVFAFANAGISFQGLTIADMLDPLPLGIAVGLFIGKQIGIFGSVFLIVKMGIARLPDGLNWRHVYGLSLLCGVGFTMSLFIGGLAFTTPEEINAVRIGVLSGSFLSAIVGALVLGLAPKPVEDTAYTSADQASFKSTEQVTTPKEPSSQSSKPSSLQQA